MKSRLALVSAKQLCRCCLIPGHTAAACRKKHLKCNQCTRHYLHNRLLCYGPSPAKPEVKPAVSNEAKSKTFSNASSTVTSKMIRQAFDHQKALGARKFFNKDAVPVMLADGSTSYSTTKNEEGISSNEENVNVSVSEGHESVTPVIDAELLQFLDKQEQGHNA